MEYKKDKRTKNLTLRDIHVGDWVQVWSETTERYSPPLKITQIHDDGTVYLVGSGDLWKENIKNVDALRRTVKSRMERSTEMSKTIYCGECDKFAYEDTDGFGFCLKTNEECRCSDKCHLTHGKP